MLALIIEQSPKGFFTKGFFSQSVAKSRKLCRERRGTLKYFMTLPRDFVHQSWGRGHQYLGVKAVDTKTHPKGPKIEKIQFRLKFPISLEKFNLA